MAEIKYLYPADRQTIGYGDFFGWEPYIDYFGEDETHAPGWETIRARRKTVRKNLRVAGRRKR